MRSRLLPVAAIATLVLLPLAACGSDDGGSTADTGPGGGAADLEVHAKDSLKFDKESYTADAGEIDVHYKNDGSGPHSLLIDDVSGFELTVGKEDRGTVTLDPGTYTLYCDVAGHRGAGMEATLKVT